MMSKFKHIFFYLLLLTSSKLWSQNDLTLYHMQSLPQRLYTNPAALPDSKFFIALPLIGNLNFDAGLSFLELKNLNNLIDEDDKRITIDLSQLDAVFKEENYLYFNNYIELGHAGISLGKNFIQANFGIKNRIRFQYPKDLIDLIVDGNGGSNLGKTFQLAPSIMFQSYAEVGIGYTRAFGKNDRFKLGTRVKLLRGLSDISTENAYLSLQTNPIDYSYSIENRLKVNTSSTGIENPWQDLGELSNNGLAVDLGFQAQLSKRLSISGAVNDIGKINWVSNTKTYFTPNQFFEFDGVRLDNILLDSQEFKADLKSYRDSFFNLFDVDTAAGGSYTTRLPAYFYLGGSFVLLNNHRIGALIYCDIFDQKIHPAFTLSYNARLTKALSLSASGSFRQGMLIGFGAGGSINMGPVQFYLVLDNIPFLGLERANYFNARTGFNLTFRRRAAIRKEKKNRKKIS